MFLDYRFCWASWLYIKHKIWVFLDYPHVLTLLSWGYFIWQICRFCLNRAGSITYHYPTCLPTLVLISTISFFMLTVRGITGKTSCCLLCYWMEIRRLNLLSVLRMVLFLHIFRFNEWVLKAQIPDIVKFLPLSSWLELLQVWKSKNGDAEVMDGFLIDHFEISWMGPSLLDDSQPIII